MKQDCVCDNQFVKIVLPLVSLAFFHEWPKMYFTWHLVNVKYINIARCCEVLYCRIFNNILKTMSNDWYECSNKYAMIDKAILSHRCSKLVIGIYSTAVLFYSIATIDFRKPINDDCRELLIKMELPFVFCDSPIYEIVACVQFVHLMAVAIGISMLDALIVTLVSCQ